MGGDKQQKKTNAMISSGQQRIEQEHAQDRGRNEGDLNASRGRGDQLYGDLYAGYNSLINSGVSGAGGSGGSGGGGGFQAPPTDSRFGEVENVYREYMNNGGVNDEARNRIRGGGVFDEYAKTGGLSDKDKLNIRSRGTSTIPAFYDAARQDANRASVVQGGYGPGSAALMSRFGRQQAAAGADAALNAELGISEQVNKGRQWGATSMSDAEKALVDRVNQGRQWGTGGLEGRAESDRSAQMAAASAAAAADRYNQEFALRQKMMGLEGLSSLYGGEGYGEYNYNKEYGLRERGLTEDSYANLIGNSRENKSNPWWKSAIGGVAGAFS